MVIKIDRVNKSYPNSVDGLPKNYNFELTKTLNMIHKLSVNRPIKITMQYPDGLLVYAPIIINAIHQYFPLTDITILNDVVYGACCVDDSALDDVDLLIHYGHSCLIPISDMKVKVLYVFVEIIIDIDHAKEMILNHINTDQVAIIGTIQFNTAVNKLAYELNKIKPGCAVVPQERILSRGEVLGCTSPVIKSPVCICIGDGRFHLEGAMIRNVRNGVKFYKYCPFDRKMTIEEYDYDKMIKIRKDEINRVINGKRIGVILSDLGKQGNIKVFNQIEIKLRELGINKIYRIWTEEINGNILKCYDKYVDGYVQVGCPRLSIDWGYNYHKPLLNPFEIINGIKNKEYESDYYSKEGDAKKWRIYQ